MQTDTILAILQPNLALELVQEAKDTSKEIQFCLGYDRAVSQAEFKPMLKGCTKNNIAGKCTSQAQGQNHRLYQGVIPGGYTRVYSKGVYQGLYQGVKVIPESILTYIYITQHMNIMYGNPDKGLPQAA